MSGARGLFAAKSVASKIGNNACQCRGDRRRIEIRPKLSVLVSGEQEIPQSVADVICYLGSTASEDAGDFSILIDNHGVRNGRGLVFGRRDAVSIHGDRT
jgi:hypothetical protein